ncbi:MAG: ABC-2 transporter permease, partial [Oscillospiraceae bacterium]
MLKLIKKEFMLAMHPTVPIMLLLSVMVLIPNYPYTVIFFYVSLAIFFTCLSCRENNDVVYSLNLPVAKKDIVKARFAFAIILEFAQLLIMVPFAVLNQTINPAGNEAGMDANIALFAIAFIVYGLFNFVFFNSYYKNVSKVGMAFVKSSVLLFILTGIDVVSTYAVPFVRDVLDTPGSQYLLQKVAFLMLGLLAYLILTAITYKKSV